MADALVKHAFVSPYLDGPDATKLQPSNWNAALLFSAGADGDLLVKDALSATGASWLSPAALKTTLGLNLVENTALSTWAGSVNLTTLGTLPGLTLTHGGAMSSTPFSGDFGAFQGLATANSVYGTPGTLVGVTADTTNDSTAIVLSIGHGLSNGQYVTIGAMAGAFVLSAVAATSATLNRVATATLTGAAVQYSQLNDPQIFWGYNRNRISKPAEPEFGWKIEANFLDATGYTVMESYLQYTGAVQVRPVLLMVNKTTERIERVDLNGGVEGLSVLGGIGDGTDPNLFRVRQTTSGKLAVNVGDWTNLLPAPGWANRTVTVLDDDIAYLTLQALGSRATLDLWATDGGGAPGCAVRAYNFLTSAPLPLWLNQNGGPVGIKSTTPLAQLAINGGVHVGGDSDPGDNNLLVDGFYSGMEITAPAAPAANGFRLFAQDNGSGKTQLMCLFATGAAQQVAIQP